MKKETSMLMDIAISGDRNVLKKVAEKILKHKDLRIETERMLNVRTKQLLITIGAAGTI